MIDADGGRAPGRERLRVRGVVQGVGFRPFVYRQARRFGLLGYVLNDGQGVLIEVQGPLHALADFRHAVEHETPPLARVEELRAVGLPLVDDEQDFVIRPSGKATGSTLVPADAATCAACLQDLRNPADRRYRYAFTNCTDCGPRYTIIQGLPYDRPMTTMSGFPMCPDCLAEYRDPGDRRFHAQPNACPVCGPRLQALQPSGEPLPCADPLRETLRVLGAGGVVAIKGLGGYHLACDASSPEAVARLRAAKARDAKPFAVMARDTETVRRLATLSEAEERTLGEPSRPIVLLRQRQPFPLAPALAPGLDTVGVMLPYTPLHHLLLDEGPPVLVMTSGNRSSEPIVTDERGAVDVLGPMVDLVLAHDRPIHARADDSVVRVMQGVSRPLRRSRGLAPDAVRLPGGTGRVLAVGGHMKNTLCLADGAQAFLSPHVGDLDHPDARDLLVWCYRHLRDLLGIEPELVVHDLHPDYPSSVWAQTLGLPTLALQHHHAHGLAALAEHRRDEPALALSLDGTGYGSDGSLWGGELLAIDGLQVRRVAHLEPLPLPGGERAVREPWRTAVAACGAAGRGAPGFTGVSAGKVAAVLGLIEGPAGDELPRSSALGRVFDAAAALLDVQPVALYEGQGPIRLEDAATRWLGAGHGWPAPLDWEWVDGGGERPDQIRLLPALAALPELRGETDRAAAAFHAAVVQACSTAVHRAAERTGLRLVALSGGVLQNALLHQGLSEHLSEAGLEVLTHRQVPANDGGLCLGQAWAGQMKLAGRG